MDSVYYATIEGKVNSFQLHVMDSASPPQTAEQSSKSNFQLHVMDSYRRNYDASGLS